MQAQIISHIQLGFRMPEVFEALRDFVTKRNGIVLPTPLGGIEAFDIDLADGELTLDFDTRPAELEAARAVLVTQ